MLATILTLLCHNQDSMAIHINCTNPILDLTLENLPFSSCNKYLKCTTIYSVLQCNTVNTFKRHLDFYLKNREYL